ncbi:MAG: hypothetical protein PVG51_17890 [Desulfosarcina sp.]
MNTRYSRNRKIQILLIPAFQIIGVQTINAIDNRFGGQLMQRTAGPAFYDLLRALNTIQQSD